MEPHRFDEFTSRILARSSRRNLGKFVAAVAVLGVLAPPADGPERAAAGQRKRRKRRCGAPGRRRLCSRRCGSQRLCGKTVNCGVCPCATTADCVANGTGDLCCAGGCVTGLCCESVDCANPTPACIDHACAPCTASAQCPAAQVCEAGGICCRPGGAACTTTGADFMSCCSKTCDSLVGGGTCAPCRGRSCSGATPCCGGETCTGGHCGGCRDRATSCSSAAQCCFSDCTSGACLSAVGGPCARDVDCRECYINSTCSNACVGGVCTV